MLHWLLEDEWVTTSTFLSQVHECAETVAVTETFLETKATVFLDAVASQVDEEVLDIASLGSADKASLDEMDTETKRNLDVDILRP